MKRFYYFILAILAPILNSLYFVYFSENSAPLILNAIAIACFGSFVISFVVSRVVVSQNRKEALSILLTYSLLVPIVYFQTRNVNFDTPNAGQWALVGVVIYPIYVAPTVLAICLCMTRTTRSKPRDLRV